MDCKDWSPGERDPDGIVILLFSNIRGSEKKLQSC